ncbi:chitin synthase activator (Chs3), putative [Talaromyces stipitatus ATCC 10500]|uniref:Chitin synthase activator (Chs3), putative n=1 Tax=Talaromyces stipitatus (strain ATCC 10500 / CBS 375.48 / QM 6759 / NRRL 1006) TaxID=441959 RepID=B8MNP9_TALSN|nr:chitin synthase activator (Chs3), putative [Talaromyces stipitatus ATCC 10500]EED14138.1 chitin synthase activator (Chs3), putative [Talaromyces stipitatus ATCC 10500]
MSRPPQGRGQPRVGATFYPGGTDDYYVPEVISPSPQRVMPEVPENMQDNLAHMEHEARSPRSFSNSSYQQSSYNQSQFPDRSSSMPSPGYNNNTFNTNNGAPSPSYNQSTYDSMDHPNFSPFPVLRNPPPNVPPTDEQKEANLEKGRVAVLSSNDPDMQLAWAQDALTYVEISMQNEARMAQIQPPRPHTPQIEHQLRMDAMNIVTFLAEQRHPHAEFIKGMWLEFGKFGFRVDKKEAFRSYSRAAEKGYARAEYRMGMQFESSNEPAKAIRHYEKGVSMRDSASYYRLGMMILLGQHGQRQDYEKGLEYIRLAAQTCDENAPQGAYVYGMLLARELPQVTVPDQFLPVDINGARINIEKAAYHGFAKAQVKMGAAYELGQLGCEFDPALSLHYNALAARQGEPEAEMAISKWFLCGHEGLFEKNDEIAFTYAQRAAQNGLPTAEFALGYFYEVGIHVPVDIQEARRWYAKAAASGNKDAAGRIDSISRSKTLSRKDHEQVAIARIKSQYGSANRPRPSYGGAAQAAPMSPPQENLEMPDPSRMRISDDGYGAPYGANGQQGYGRGSSYGADRPSSAFGINPNIGSPGYGPGGPGLPASPAYGRVPSAGPGAMGYRQGGSGPNSPKLPPSQGDPYGSPRPDIGYSAPMDRRRLQRPETQGMGGPPDRRSGKTPDYNRPNPGAYPPRNQSMTPSSMPPGGAGRPSPGTSPRPSVGGAPPGGPMSAPPSSNPTPNPPAAAAPPPKKGPKTFEEMGVPQGKSESDCVSSFPLLI